MELRVENIAKRFVSHWVFRELSFHIPPGTHMAISGPNGCGKSTLLRLIAGVLPKTDGTIIYLLDGTVIKTEEVFRYVSYAAPYAELIEEFTVPEAWAFHKQFRPVYAAVSGIDALFGALTYPFDRHVRMHDMSSGMKQRLRLAFALYTDTPLLLLDEPTSNLDTAGIEWYKQQLDTFGHGRTVIIASNVRSDLEDCSMELDLSHWYISPHTSGAGENAQSAKQTT
jgi:ABC-type multidrug transport system ATPase subunit